ncbi:MAG: D-alanine--D-alanine ligase [Chlorobiaceae bacterium]|nr:D-alanine--D-alanine ligase [Chlorobiaceae bacterium]MBA4309242.1 D-alanine--D-alanine ligase [Chlorobiaceae bacterium]
MKIKIAVIYNEFPLAPPKPKQTFDPKLLGFNPVFDIEDNSPEEAYRSLSERLANRGFDVYTLNIKDDLILLINSLKKEKPDVIFNFVEIFNSVARLEMNICGLYELMKIPYTGASPLGLANCQNKILTKRILKSIGIKTAKFELVEKIQDRYTTKLKYPIIVKPAFEDASIGIDFNAVVRNSLELKNRLNYILMEFKQTALLEEYIDGRELNVAVLGNQNPTVLPISEIDFSTMPPHLDKIVSFQAKWDQLHEAYHKTLPICPAILPKSILKKAEAIALQAFKTMGTRDYARVDMRLTDKNQLFVLEVNPNPDLTEGAGFMRSAEAFGLSYDETLEKIIFLALERAQKKVN